MDSNRTPLVAGLALTVALAGGLFAWFAMRGDPDRGGAARPERAAPEVEEGSRAAELEGPANLEEPGRKLSRAESVPELAQGATGSAARHEHERAPEERVRGRVVDPAGAGIERAWVFASASMSGPIDYLEERPMPWFDREMTRTDDEGWYELEGIGAGTVLVAARAPGFAPLDRPGLVVPRVEEAGQAVELPALVMTPGAVLAGHVVGPRGEPVEGAELTPVEAARGSVSFFFSDSPRATTVASAADGSFRLDQLAPGPYRILVRSEEHPVRIFEGVCEEPGRETAVRFELEPGAEITGLVIGSPKDERGDLVVRARPVDEGGFSPMTFLGTRRAELEADGAFRVRGLRPGKGYDLSLRRQSGEGRAWFEGARSQAVRAQAGQRGVEIPYRHEASLSFQVVDAGTREPITDFRVNAGITWARPLQGEDGRALSEHPEGRVVVGDLYPETDGDRMSLEIRATGYEEFQSTDVAIAAGERTELGVIALDPIPVVRVLVRDASSGEPVEGARVRLRVETAAEEGGMMRRTISIGTDDDEIAFRGGRGTRTDSDGVAVLSSFPGETCALEVTADGYAPASLRGQYLPPGEVVEREIELSRGGEVLVTVVDAEGSPLAGARVRHREPGENPGAEEVIILGQAPGADSITDAKGQVLFTNLEPGEHGFRLEEGSDSGGFVMRRPRRMRLLGEPQEDEHTSVVVLEGERSELLLAASPRGSLSGRIREVGKPLAGADLSLREHGEEEFSFPGMGGGPAASAGADGEYEFEDITAGNYVLTVRHPSRHMPERFDVKVDAGANSLDLDLPVSVIEGRVTDAEGKPLAGVHMRAEQHREEGRPRMIGFMMRSDGDDTVVQVGDSARAETVYTDADGRYSLRGVMADAELVVRGEGTDVQPGRSEPVSVEADEIKGGVDLVLQPAGSVQVEALFSDGSPARMCMVRASYQGDQEAAAVEPKFSFIESGSTVLRGLKPGPWNLNVQRAGPGGDDQDSVDQVVEITAQETARATVHLP